MTQLSYQEFTTTDAERTSEFYDDLHIYYETVGIFDEEDPYTTTTGLLRDRIEATGVGDKIRDGVVLDAGCGAWQKGTRILKGFGPKRISAVDFNQTSLEHCRKDRQPNTNYSRQNLAQLSFPDATFDVIVCEGVVHHTIDPSKTLDELVRVLKPGGYLTLGVYCWRFPYTTLSKVLRSTMGRKLDFKKFLHGSGTNKTLLIFADFIFVPIEHTMRLKPTLKMLEDKGTSVVFNDMMWWPIRGLGDRAKWFFKATGLDYRHIIVQKDA